MNYLIICHSNHYYYFFFVCTFIDISGALVQSVLKNNQIAQHVVSDVGNKTKQNGSAGRENKKATFLKIR